VTFSVWKALFLREAVYRIAQDRIAWLWLILEPVAHVALMMWVFTGFARSSRSRPALFITLACRLFLARNVMTSAMDAIPRNAVFFPTGNQAGGHGAGARRARRFAEIVIPLLDSHRRRNPGL
jgi:ABC-type polysaccharide/polyol phosphate export permease